jgi:integrase
MATPKYRKHSSRDFAFIEVHGERIRLPGSYNSADSRAAYHDYCAKLEREPDAPVRTTAADVATMTILELTARYLVHLEQRHDGGKRGDVPNNQDAIDVLLQHFASVRAADFGPKLLRAFQDRLADTKKKPKKGSPEGTVGENLSRRYVNAQVSRIKTMFKWAVAEELVPPSLHHALSAVRGLQAGRSKARETAKKKPVPLRYVKATLPFVSKVVRAMLRLQVLTGVRSGSICKAKPEQFDTTKKLWIWKPRHKTEKHTAEQGTELVIPIGPRAQKVLAPWLKACGEKGDFLFSPRTVRNDRRYRKHYDSQSYGNAVTRAIKQANKARSAEEQIPHWSPHLIRHFKGDSVNEVYGIEAAQAVLGHDSISATKVYTSRRLSLAKKVAKETG